MSGYNANFRNLHSGDLSTFDGSANFAGGANVPPLSPVLEPFMVLSCGTTTNWDLVSSVGFSFFRTNDVVANQRYNARQGNFEVDTPGRVIITVTARGFTPFVSAVRDADQYVIVSDGSGIAKLDITTANEGPVTVEVTSIEPYATGSFTIDISCGNKEPSNTVVQASPNPSCLHDKVTYTVTVTDSTLSNGVPSGVVTLSDDSGTLAMITLVDGTGSYSTARQPIGSHTVVASYPGDDIFDPSTGQVIEVIQSCPGRTTCPTGDLQLDAATITFINDYLTWQASLISEPYTGPSFSGIVPRLDNCEWLVSVGLVSVLISRFVGPNIAIQIATTPLTNTMMTMTGNATWLDPAGTWSVAHSPSGFSPSNPPNWPPPATVTISWA